MGRNSFFVDDGWKKCEIAQGSCSCDVCRIKTRHDISLIENKSNAEQLMFCSLEVSSSRRNVTTTGTISRYSTREQVKKTWNTPSCTHTVMKLTYILGPQDELKLLERQLPTSS